MAINVGQLAIGIGSINTYNSLSVRVSRPAQAKQKPSTWAKAANALVFNPVNFAWQLGVAAVGQALVTPVTRAAQLKANQILPNVAPPMDAIINAYQRGGFTYEQLKEALKWHGVSLSSLDGLNANLHGWWHTCLRLAAPLPAINDLIDMQRTLGKIPIKTLGREEELSDWLQRAGIWDEDWRKWLVDTDYPFDLDELLLAWSIMGWDEARVRNELARIGYVTPQAQDLALSLWAPLDPGNCLVARNRGLIDDDVLDNWLSRNGMYNASVRAVAKELRYEIPSPSDLVRFSVKEVWNRDVVREFGYDEEIDQIPEFFHFMEQAGFGGNASMPGGAPGGPRNWGMAHWRAHWANMGLGDAFLAWQRFRPGRMDKWRREFPNLRPFPMEQLNRILKINDYPPGLRDWLAALSRPPLRFFDIRATIVNGYDSPSWFTDATGIAVANPADPSPEITAWSVEELRDRGYSERDASHAASLFLKVAKDKANAINKSRTIRYKNRWAEKLLDQYATGILTNVDLRAGLRLAGWTDEAIGWAIDDANAHDRTVYVKAWIKRVRRFFTSGRVSADQARQALLNSGIREGKANEYIDSWILLLGEGQKFATTAQIMKWFEMGFLTPASATFRLANLGWSQPDMILLFAQSGRHIQEGEVKAAAANDKARLAAARDLERSREKLLAQAKAAQANLRRATPATMLRDLLKKERISADFFRSRMTSMGYEPLEIDLHIKECCGGNGQGKIG